MLYGVLASREDAAQDHRPPNSFAMKRNFVAGQIQDRAPSHTSTGKCCERVPGTCDAGSCKLLQETGAALAGMRGCARPHWVGHRRPKQVPSSQTGRARIQPLRKHSVLSEEEHAKPFTRRDW